MAIEASREEGQRRAKCSQIGTCQTCRVTANSSFLFGRLQFLIPERVHRFSKAFCSLSTFNKIRRDGANMPSQSAPLESATPPPRPSFTLSLSTSDSVASGNSILPSLIRSNASVLNAISLARNPCDDTAKSCAATVFVLFPREGLKSGWR
jgi:hypothetical protein